MFVVVKTINIQLLMINLFSLAIAGLLSVAARGGIVNNTNMFDIYDPRSRKFQLNRNQSNAHIVLGQKLYRPTSPRSLRRANQAQNQTLTLNIVWCVASLSR